MQKEKLFCLINKPIIILSAICLLGFLLYWPSLFVFFTHDDFFHLKISNARSLLDFLNFFNLTSAPEGFGFYRPLTTQAYYFLGFKFFNLNPLPLHLISFAFYFSLIFMVFKLAKAFLKSNLSALIVAFLYGVSATHFGQLYFLGAFQELGFGFFFFASILAFIKFLHAGNKTYYLVSLLLFAGALMSKEFAVMLPIVLVLVYFYLVLQKAAGLTLRRFIMALAPFTVILFGYLYLHIFSYGLAEGDSYIWEFSPRVANTLFWYLLWSFNLPEMLVDFIGPNLKPVPNLFKNYFLEAVPILILFFIQIGILLSGILGCLKTLKSSVHIYILGVIWFVVTLLPVLFLPWHKFAFELTVPLFGVALVVGFLLKHFNKFIAVSFLLTFLLLSVLTNQLTYKTHWITQGGAAARKTIDYINTARLGKDDKAMSIVFYDSPEDRDLPWKPSEQMKNILSDNDFSEVFYGGLVTAIYGGRKEDVSLGIEAIKSRDLLGY